MSEEQREILRMLAEGTIKLEDAERLLNALEDGKQKQAADRTGGTRKQQGIQDAVNSVRDAVAGIGPMVGRLVGEITTEIQKERNFPGESEAEQLPPLQFEGNEFHIDGGTRLYIRNDKDGGPGGGDLDVESIDGDACRLEAREAINLRILRSSSGPVIRWAGGPLKVKAPATVAELFAYTLGGDLNAGHLDCPTHLKSTGGDVKLIGAGPRFAVKTIGGNIRLSLTNGFKEPSEVKSMGGNIRVEVADGAAGTDTVAVSIGGSIMVEDSLGPIRREGILGKQKVKVRLGGDRPGSALEVRTLGGNIEIRRARHG